MFEGWNIKIFLGGLVFCWVQTEYGFQNVISQLIHTYTGMYFYACVNEYIYIYIYDPRVPYCKIIAIVFILPCRLGM